MGILDGPYNYFEISLGGFASGLSAIERENTHANWQQATRFHFIKGLIVHSFTPLPVLEYAYFSYYYI